MIYKVKQNLDKIIDNNLYLEAQLLKKISLGEYEPKQAVNTLWKANHDYAINAFVENGSNKKSKHHFSICGLLDEFQISTYNSRIPDYGLRHICMPILSDNEDLIKRYAALRYVKHPVYAPKSMDEMVELGDTAITFNTIQHFMAENLEGVRHNLAIYEKYKKKVLRSGKTLEIDYRFFYALLARDRSKIEESIRDLLAPKAHKRRNDSPVLGEIVSLPALGYAKLAWRYGIEVDIDSHLIPKELLPIQSLEQYEIPYDFLNL
ncbi:immunity 49 family protein [Jiulongibacter sediminis]|uniref:Immunity protein 49 n=1 Tax=Jiulongibacter sediminis TaxID=1605367 RepID=A0A0P7C348_9BACT|nr:immunity 49 family protein [Jiulongibacter sediminis]KPM48642.1 hypothetical protein AFM12_08540 [Jiulongibacter sediminis]TBX25179.1 hypothetical protein TK44_08545 [Jiulongibacter sediminis]